MTSIRPPWLLLIVLLLVVVVKTQAKRARRFDITKPNGYDKLKCGRLARKRFTSGGLVGTFAARRSRRASQRPQPSLHTLGGLLPQPAVVGGVNATRNAWPWMALFGKRESGDNMQWFCAGALLNDQWVLTAAHCLTNFGVDVVRLGEHDFNNDNDGADHEDFSVAETIIHPNYTSSQAYHDLALLKLSTKVTLQQFIKPVCLPWGRGSNKVLIGQTATITGWGNTKFRGSQSSILQEVDVKLFDPSVCAQSYSGLVGYLEAWPKGIGPETVCAGDPQGGKDACQGDSGGPLVILGSGRRPRYKLAGVVSRGNGCGEKDFPGIYVRVAYKPYLAWIKQIAF